VYAHEFDRFEHAGRVRDGLEDAFAGALAGSAQAASARGQAQNEPAAAGAEVADLRRQRG
jgi:hypothetical protein